VAELVEQDREKKEEDGGEPAVTEEDVEAMIADARRVHLAARSSEQGEEKESSLKRSKTIKRIDQV